MDWLMYSRFLHFVHIAALAFAYRNDRNDDALFDYLITKR